jgi:short-subunit dehydrogenase
MAPLTWFITGASSGLGQALALEALNAGHRVIGTTRDVEKAQISFPEFETKGGSWMKLDPGDAAAYAQVVQFSKEYSIDVLVNNAGYAFIGGIEDTR